MLSIASLVNPDDRFFGAHHQLPYFHPHPPRHDPCLFLKHPAPPPLLLSPARVKAAAAMARTKPNANLLLKPTARSAPSGTPELGVGHWGTTYNSRTGRPVRKLRAPADSPFVDSALALSDDEEDDDESGEEVQAPSRKRKRSPSPHFSDDNEDPAANLSDSPDDAEDSGDEIQLAAAPTVPAAANSSNNPVSVTIKNFTINIPLGHTGPLLLQIDPASLGFSGSSAVPAAQPSPPTTRPAKRRKVSNPGPETTKTASANPNRAGFLDLPAELRNEIYRQVFTTEKRIDFAHPKNFSRGAALLRTCRQVHEEARTILYGENAFCFSRRTSRYGSFWVDEWRELGFRAVRKFVKSVGPTNVSLIRHVIFQFEDATPCLNPGSMTHDERRFVNDDILISILRTLGDFAQLQKFEMNFHGRRRVERSDQRFLDYLKRIKADDVSFFNYPIGLQTAYATESKQEDAVAKMLLKSMTRKHKLYLTNQ